MAKLTDRLVLVGSTPHGRTWCSFLHPVNFTGIKSDLSTEKSDQIDRIHECIAENFPADDAVGFKQVSLSHSLEVIRFAISYRWMLRPLSDPPLTVSSVLFPQYSTIVLFVYFV